MGESAGRPSETELVARWRVLDSMVEGVNVSDREGIIFFTNRAFDEMFGYERAELHGKHVSVLNAMSQKESAALVEEIISTLVTRGWWEGEFLNRRKDGTEFTTRARINTVEIARARYWVSLQEDITERRKLEEQLRHAQKVDAIGQLAGGIAHEFNNLVTGIQGYASALRTELPPDHRGYADLNGILEATERAAALTRRLLSFGRREPSRPHPVDVVRVIDGLQTLLDRVVAEPRVVIERGVTEAFVCIDPMELEQAIVNLVLNAKDAGPRDGVIHVRLRAGEDAEANEVIIEVRDRGCGMSKQVADRIFDPFFTTKSRDAGTGLGLVIVAGIIRQAAGMIEVESTPGEGTAVTIRLPRASRFTPELGHDVTNAAVASAMRGEGKS